ncbi:Gluconolactonase precursor [Lacunisphaera limnophila]|uniref:Gluconolactonase n=1 Tax=Lacunisphaera limnophila TaxID=1838286 RepID=A0A1D8AUH9_9BACT|nr:SMP-30/gluconolactonase/LRE family protein [Lacunisphaera limnophila]AOS44516.1 Gluconolactonase precursor [Lacunisphaera limnophila]
MKLPPVVLASFTTAAVMLTAAPAPITSSAAPYPKDAKATIERLDPALDALLAADVVIEHLASGFNWSEGPIWVPAQGALLFSDVPENRVYRWKDGEGISVFLEPSGFTGTQYNGRERGSNGLTLDPAGRLTLCQHGDRRVARLAADGKSFETVVDRFEGSRFSSPNDLCFDRAGNLFFTDPPYGLPGDLKQEIPFQGVFRLGTDGQLTVIARELHRPNGVALSVDEKTVYVASSEGQEPWIKAYALNADGTVASSRIFFDGSALMKQGRRGAFDGLKVDEHGNVWTTGPGGVLILSPEGKHLGSILTGRATANCAFGDADHMTFYMTADEALLRVRTKVKGAGR